MLNLFPISIGAISGINTSVVLVRYGYVGLYKYPCIIVGCGFDLDELIWLIFPLADLINYLWMNGLGEMGLYHNS